MDSNYGLKIVFSFQIYHGSYLTPKSIFFFYRHFSSKFISLITVLEEFFKHPLQPLKLQIDIPRFQKYMFVYFIARAQNHYTLLCGLLMVFNTCIYMYCNNYNVQAVIHFFISLIKMKIKLIDEASFVEMQNITCASIFHYLFGQPRIW